MSAEADPRAVVDFCGEKFPVSVGRAVVLGREGDIAIEDNPYLHRRFLEVLCRDAMVWLRNVGSAVSATVADEAGLVQSWLGPGAVLPLVFPHTVVWFTAGPTTYELDIYLDRAPFVPSGTHTIEAGTTTMGRVSFTPDQLLLVLALAEPVLRGGPRGRGSIPASKAAADRLGWTITKFNRKLDNVCEKLTRMQVRGLAPTNGAPASNRRARLVEYALATRLITTDDVTLLDVPKA